MDAGRLGVCALLRERMNRFSPSERRIARLLLADPGLGTVTVSLLARRAGVSAPTVVRFARRCGFRGFPALREALRVEVSGSAPPCATGRDCGGDEAVAPDRAGQARGPSPPPTRPGHGGRGRPPHAGTARAATLLARRTRETLTSLPPEQLEAAVRLLGSARHRVLLDGGGPFTGIVARCLALRLMELRREVRPLPRHAVHLAAAIRGLRRSDVVVLFDHRPYEERLARVAREARAAGARILLFTDPWFSPVTEIADVVLTAPVESVSPRTSLVPTLALVEALTAVLADSGDRPTSG